MELLSPAGSLQAVYAAVNNGADAVYLGPKLFNARRLAHNFSDAELKEAIGFCHLHKVKVYLTMNTLVRNEEMKLWFSSLAKYYEMGIDAVIIQEISFAPLLRKFFPGLEIHASTQASFMNAQGMKSFPEMDLFVLARELSEEEIRYIRKKIKQKLEMFVHGHQCISYSGQCLISSLIGSRSGNRGVCASSCRKYYNNSGYLISPRDLMLANKVDTLMSIGIDSVKLEGRMKSPEYVGVATKTYRKQIDDASQHRFKPLTDHQVHDLKMGFNREFTEGFFSVESIIDPEMPMNRGIALGTITDSFLCLQHDLKLGDGVSFWKGSGSLEGGKVLHIIKHGKQVSKAYKGDPIKLHFKQWGEGIKVFLTSQEEEYTFKGKKKLVSLAVSGKPGNVLTLHCKEFSCSAASSITLQVSEKHPLTQQELEEELAKCNYLSVRISAFDVKKCFLPKSKLTELRRVLEQTILEASCPRRHPEEVKLPAFAKTSGQQRRLIVKVYTLEQVKEADDCKVDVIVFDIFHSQMKEAQRLCKNARFFVDTPVILSDTDIEKIEHVLKELQPDGMMIGNLGLLDVNFKGEKLGNYSLNVFNDITMGMLLNKGILPMYSLELSILNLQKFSHRNGIVYAHGRIPVMHFKDILPEKKLTDDKNYTFPLRMVHGNTEMLYSRPIAAFEKVLDIETLGINQFFLDLERDTTTIIHAYQNIFARTPQDITMLKRHTTVKPFLKGVA